MARETKAERVLREKQEMETKFNSLVLEYPQRVMSALRACMSEGFSINVCPSTMKFYIADIDRDWGFDLAWQMTSWDDYNDMVYLETHIEFCKGLREEATRKNAVKAAALAKLTAEERELLGIYSNA